MISLVGPAAIRRLYAGPTINVRTFGARGDGRSDDTGALRRAVASIGQSSELVTVEFPAGVYLVSDELVLPSNVRLLGSGAQATSIKAVSAFNQAKSAAIVSCNGRSGIVIEALHFDKGDFPEGRGVDGHGIDLGMTGSASRDVQILSCLVTGQSRHGALIGGDCDGLLVRDTTMIGRSSPTDGWSNSDTRIHGGRWVHVRSRNAALRHAGWELNNHQNTTFIGCQVDGSCFNAFGMEAGAANVTFLSCHAAAFSNYGLQIVEAGTYTGIRWYGGSMKPGPRGGPLGPGLSRIAGWASDVAITGCDGAPDLTIPPR